MKDTLFYDSLFQAGIISPIMGAVFGLVFGWFAKTGRQDLPVQDRVIIIHRIREIHYIQPSKQNTGDTDEFSVLLSLGIIGAIVIAGYVANLAIITHYLVQTIYTISSFLAAFYTIALIKAFIDSGFSLRWISEIALSAMFLYISYKFESSS
jgi:hypothetical protein